MSRTLNFFFCEIEFTLNRRREAFTVVYLQLSKKKGEIHFTVFSFSQSLLFFLFHQYSTFLERFVQHGPSTRLACGNGNERSSKHRRDVHFTGRLCGLPGMFLRIVSYLQRHHWVSLPLPLIPTPAFTPHHCAFSQPL